MRMTKWGAHRDSGTAWPALWAWSYGSHLTCVVFDVSGEYRGTGEL